MKTSVAKAKGRSLQNWVRDKILSIFPSLDPEDDCKSCLMSDRGEDIKLSKKARQLFPFSVECKSYKAFAVYKHFKQAQKNAGNNTPLLIIKQNRDNPLVVLDAEVFFELYSKISKSSP